MCRVRSIQRELHPEFTFLIGQPELPRRRRYQITNGRYRLIEKQPVIVNTDLARDIECTGRQVGNAGQQCHVRQLGSKHADPQGGTVEAGAIRHDPLHLETVVAEDTDGFFDGDALWVRSNGRRHVEGLRRQSPQTREIVKNRNIGPDSPKRNRRILAAAGRQ